VPDAALFTAEHCKCLKAMLSKSCSMVQRGVTKWKYGFNKKFSL